MIKSFSLSLEKRKAERLLDIVNKDEKETDARIAVDRQDYGLLCIRNYKTKKCIQVMYW